MPNRTGYKPISDYGFLSDCRSAALVSSDGSVDWLCWPRFDSPSLFAKILDAGQGGSFSLTPTQRYCSTRRYIPGTNVLETTFTTETGKARVTDWLHKGSRQALCRLVEGLEGELELEAVCDPRPDYGRGGAVAWTDRMGYLVCDMPELGRLVLDGMSSGHEHVVVRADDMRHISLGLGRPGPSDLLSSLTRTVDFWEHWSEDLTLPEYEPEAVRRSALVLKGLQYEPSGAIIAAATTSLPETVGGDRNYDYRYSWLRDSSMTLQALHQVGKDEANSYFDWLRAISVQAGYSRVQIMYGVDGEEQLPEYELDHLEGHRQSRPVRVGNAAAAQRQLDVYGEVLDAIWLHYQRINRPVNPHRWLFVKELTSSAIAEWQEPDEGIWEVRGEPQHFVYSKVMCWVALDRAIRLAEYDPRLLDDAPLAVWRSERDAIHAQVMKYGYDEQLGAFTQAYGSGSLDASNLLLAEVGFVAADDPKFVSTVRAIQHDLCRGGLVDRYKHETTDDGFSGQEGTFSICSLWLVKALVDIGAVDEATDLFERMLSYASDLGLLSEELTPDGEQLGNFPQAFTHLALINCAFALSAAGARPAQSAPAQLAA